METMKEEKKAVKVTRETWVKLQEVKSIRQAETGQSISFSDVILYLISIWSKGGRDHDRQ